MNLNELICFNFYTGWRGITSIYKEILGKGITPQNFYILELCSIDERITINELSRAMNIDSSAVSTLIARMEKKSLVRRIHGTEDRRTVFVLLTQQGNELRENLRSRFEELTGTIGNNISREDADKLSEIVDKITHNRRNKKREAMVCEAG